MLTDTQLTETEGNNRYRSFAAFPCCTSFIILNFHACLSQTCLQRVPGQEPQVMFSGAKKSATSRVRDILT